MKDRRPLERNPLARFIGGIGLATIFLLLGPETLLAQCALCRDAVAASSSETREAMNYAIIGLAFMPYGVVVAAAWVSSPALRALVRAKIRSLVIRDGGEGR